jgi:predicted RNA-binding protein YlxR (DUF448 family)
MEPVRTCVGCRARAEKSSLLRVVAQTVVAQSADIPGGVAAQKSVVVADEAAVLPGRGAYIHPSQACFEKAVKRRAFGRALHIDSHDGTPLDTANLQTKLNGIVKKAL